MSSRVKRNMHIGDDLRIVERMVQDETMKVKGNAVPLGVPGSSGVVSLFTNSDAMLYGYASIVTPSEKEQSP